MQSEWKIVCAREKEWGDTRRTMDVGTDQESSLFQAFIVPSVGIENKNVNKTNDPIVRI